MLNLKGWTADRIKQRAMECEFEALEYDKQGATTLAMLKRRDAVFYRRQLGPVPVQ